MSGERESNRIHCVESKISEDVLSASLFIHLLVYFLYFKNSSIVINIIYYPKIYFQIIIYDVAPTLDRMFL